MQLMRPARTRWCATILAASLLAGCDGGSPTETNALSGSYTATTFRAQLDGQSPIDVLAAGGTLAITLTANDVVSGSLFLPGTLTGEGDMTATMAGTVVRNGSIVRFQQSADTFVRDLDWTVGSGQLTVVNQRAGEAVFTITLTRQ